jgi:hypothetical protein
MTEELIQEIARDLRSVADPHRGDHVAAVCLAASLVRSFDEGKGKSYVALYIDGDPRGEVEVVIRPAWGENRTPAQVAEELRQKLDILQTEYDSLSRVLDEERRHNRRD